MKTKTALITGAASGLGYELAFLLIKDGYNLVLVDIDASRLKEVKKLFNEKFKSEVNLLVKDLSQPDIAQDIYNEVKRLPKIDVLVNNAGFGLFGTFANTDWKRESDMLHLHILTTTHLTKLILPAMISRKSGKILNISSLAAFQPGPLMSLYYASKSYILSFSEAIANELKGTGVTVTALCPGPTKTLFQETVSNDCSENKISFNMACPVDVALYGYNAMKKGKTIAIPGAFNKILSSIPRFIPRNMTTRIVRNIQEKNRET
ncbi:SDR family NAD(P)-dependent oxidoreductase [Flavivirga jejuensis]|uniref:SDR family oxidoreductase n=1 Tax=Flavivirga jejuensis TaxID=870487 RepID=A0ABT8WKM2_9FLAO|nr:SDR family oxidoreductase [Flavivirga jejuensis]MDO5973539.1 SDR family oxidoreductase [Flavivirga jejuensis]